MLRSQIEIGGEVRRGRGDLERDREGRREKEKVRNKKYTNYRLDNNNS